MNVMKSKRTFFLKEDGKKKERTKCKCEDRVGLLAQYVGLQSSPLYFGAKKHLKEFRKG